MSTSSTDSSSHNLDFINRYTKKCRSSVSTIGINLAYQGLSLKI